MSAGASEYKEPAHAGVHLGHKFRYGEVIYEPSPPSGENGPLGVLDAFKGTFAGTGFNTIFRPNSVAPTTTGYPKDFPNPVIPAPPSPPNVSVLELNLTQEELAFSDPLGSVPNRGLGLQNDISINGVTYLQVVNDVTNTATGKGDGKPTGIHTETGFWLNVPKTDNNPNMTDTLVRLGSIPHGTTINAQGPAATVTPGPPAIGERCITPFVIGDPADIQKKDSQKVDLTNTPRLPQDLTKFVAAGTITQRYLDNPTNILLDTNEQLNIISTCTFEVTTQSDPPPTPAKGDTSTPDIPGGGTANIAFLVGGAGGAGPNANAVRMSATFWVEVVSSTITIPPTAAGATTPPLTPSYNAKTDGRVPPPLPSFCVKVNEEVTQPTPFDVKYTQIQYEQIVLLNFATLSWPHLSLATLVPKLPIHLVYPAKSE